jgi:hypothetical protein
VLEKLAEGITSVTLHVRSIAYAAGLKLMASLSGFGSVPPLNSLTMERRGYGWRR